jgi:hypothetical protein
VRITDRYACDLPFHAKLARLLLRLPCHQRCSEVALLFLSDPQIWEIVRSSKGLNAFTGEHDILSCGQPNIADFVNELPSVPGSGSRWTIDRGR